jgi:hypothetical protein
MVVFLEQGRLTPRIRRHTPHRPEEWFGLPMGGPSRYASVV